MCWKVYCQKQHEHYMFHKLSWQCYTPRTGSLAIKPTGQVATPNIPVHSQYTFFTQRWHVQACTRTHNNGSVSCACTRSFKKDLQAHAKACPSVHKPKQRHKHKLLNAQGLSPTPAVIVPATAPTLQSHVVGPAQAVGVRPLQQQIDGATVRMMPDCDELQPIIDDRLRCSWCYLGLHRGKRRKCTLSVAHCRKQRKQLARSEPIWIQRCLACGACGLP